MLKIVLVELIFIILINSETINNAKIETWNKRKKQSGSPLGLYVIELIKSEANAKIVLFID